MLLPLFIGILSELNREVPQPTSEAAIKKFVSHILSEDSLEILDKMNCAICTDKFVENDKILITTCKHSFHEDCIKPWLDMSNKCPNCREVFK